MGAVRVVARIFDRGCEPAALIGAACAQLKHHLLSARQADSNIETAVTGERSAGCGEAGRCRASTRGVATAKWLTCFGGFLSHPIVFG